MVGDLRDSARGDAVIGDIREDLPIVKTWRNASYAWQDCSVRHQGSIGWRHAQTLPMEGYSGYRDAASLSC